MIERLNRVELCAIRDIAPNFSIDTSENRPWRFCIKLSFTERVHLTVDDPGSSMLSAIVSLLLILCIIVAPLAIDARTRMVEPSSSEEMTTLGIFVFALRAGVLDSGI